MPAKPRRPKAPEPAPAASSDVAMPPPPVAAAPEPPRLTWRALGVGVGSAGLVAALLYAARARRKDWTK